MAELKAAGVPTSIFLAPVIPAVEESEALCILDAAAAAGADAAMVQPLRLSAGVREWLLPRLAARLPEAARVLARLYDRRENLLPDERQRLLAPILARRAGLGLDRPVAPLRERSEQLPLFTCGPRAPGPKPSDRTPT